jgi:Protein of unknown function (DUF3987)/VirE N-terminal domain
VRVLTISMITCATETETRDISVEKVWEAIRTGGRKLKGQITQIRNRFEAELALTSGDYKKAKQAVDALKKQLPAVTWSGTFSQRANDKLVQHSGLLCADLDSLGPLKAEVRVQLARSPHVVTVFDSPSGDGLKAVFRVPADAAKHMGSFRAVGRHVLELTGIQVDQSGKDVARLCFMSYDPELYRNANAVEIEPLPKPEKPKRTFSGNGAVNLSERQKIAEELLGNIQWESETSGFVTCPGKHLHTTGDSERDCKIDFDQVPTIHCFHDHCRGILDAINRELRSRIGKAEWRGNNTQRVSQSVISHSGDGEPAELPLRPAPYVPPALTLLPQVLQEYVNAAAESLNVDLSFIFLPLLSALGSAIGNSRSILLKRNFTQSPVIWSGIIGRSGSRKSPSLDAGCFAVLEHELELMQQNNVTQEEYEERLAEWEGKIKKERGAKPEAPRLLTCLMDDLTLAALADAMITNPRGVLEKKDEISHWFASFDQFTNAKGADISRWLSLHTGVFFGLDRRTDKRSYRIWNPRVCITGGIQPPVLARVLTEDFFERGLPARFLFAFPPMRQDKWSEAEIPDNLRNAMLEVFAELWLLQPELKDRLQQPKLIRLDADAKDAFVEFYNECGASAVASDEHEEAAWCKLTGYAARLALVGQLAGDPSCGRVTGKVMQAACELARWFGSEASRIYSCLGETREQREQRKLIEFIESQGGAVRVRDLITYYWPLRNQPEKAKQQLNQLLKVCPSRWQEVRTARRGRPTREFHLLRTSASAKIPDIRGKTPNCADAEAPNVQKITPFIEPNNQAVSRELDVMPTGLLEL